MKTLLLIAVLAMTAGVMTLAYLQRLSPSMVFVGCLMIVMLAGLGSCAIDIKAASQ